MLEGLDAIPWSTMHHALGQASDVPALLRMALSDIKEARDEALGDDPVPQDARQGICRLSLGVIG